MEIQNFQVTELTLTQEQEVNGGIMLFPKLPKWAKGGLLTVVVGVIIDNWAEIKSGLVDGYTDGSND